MLPCWFPLEELIFAAHGPDAELPAVSEIDLLINIKYKQLREMLSSIRASEVKRKIINLTPITQLPPLNYFNAALQIQTHTHKHTDILMYSSTRIHLQCRTCRCIAHTRSWSTHTYMQLAATFHNAGVQFRQRYTQTERGRANRPTMWGGQLYVWTFFFF